VTTEHGFLKHEFRLSQVNALIFVTNATCPLSFILLYGLIFASTFKQIKVISYYLHNQFIPPFVSTFFTLNICLFSYCVQFVVQGRIEPYFISSWQCALYYIFLHNIIEPYFAPHSSYTNNINDYSFLSHTVLILCTYAR
jgi:hypothetical protein